jgi:PD-(D/E)XK nuclease superfamily protein
MDRSTLTPAQLRVLDELMATGLQRPEFDADLPVRLRDELESGLAPVADQLGVGELSLVSKSRLAQVHACEAHYLASAEGGFAWNLHTARGTVVHKALELSVAARGDVPPLDLVDHALNILTDDDHRNSPRPWLLDAGPLDIAALRAAANDVVSKFFECWPPLQSSWTPRTETGIGVELCDERITLWAKVDLILGRARGQQARVLVVDLKTGRSYPTHLDDLRFYALVQALRVGVPPFRVASYYLDTASFHAEDITEEILQSTVRRVIAGVTKMAELTIRSREPSVTEGPQCGWCQLRHHCDGAKRWLALADNSEAS